MFELLFTHPLWAYRNGTFAFASGWPLWLLWALILTGIVAVAATLWRRRGIGMPKLLLVGTLQTALLVLIISLIWRPVLNVERVRDRENVLAVAVDASSSMAYGDASQSRLQQSVAALQGGPLASLQKVFDVKLFSFARETQPLTALDAVPPPGPQTRIGDALLQMLQSAGSVPMAGIILLSDGGENGDTLDEARLTQIASFGVPVHTVGVGEERDPQDLELEDIDVAGSAPALATVSALFSVRHDGAADTRLRVYDRDRLLATQQLKLPANAAVSNFSIEIPAGEPGTRDLRFTLDPLAGERNEVNNTRRHVMDVPGAQRSVLYVEGEPRWEYKFLRRAVEGERAIRLASVVRTTPNKLLRQGVNSSADLADGFPTDAAELFAYDAVIIGNYEAQALTADQHRLLKEFVDTRGGTVLLLAGTKGLSAGGWGNAAIAPALPTHLPSKDAASFMRREIRVQPTVYGAEFATTRLDADPKRNAEQWKTLPALADHQLLGRTKPGAIVLLETATERGRVPLLVWQRYGRGATYLLGTASTMRWQMHLAPEDQRHETFWRQLVHALADSTPARITLAAERSVYNDEHTMVLEAEVRDEKFVPLNAADIELLVAPERAEAFTQTMQPSGNNDGRYVARVDAGATGLYRIDMTARAGGRSFGAATTHVRRNDGELEHFGTRQNRAVLERIAAMTGGRYWTLNELQGLAAAIPYSKAGIVERQTLDLWNLPIVFLLLFALKMGEWLLRLTWGRL